DEVDKADFANKVKEVDQKAKDALNTLKEIEDTIKKLEDTKAATNYKVASDEKQKVLDDALKELKNLKDSNLLDDGASTKLANAKTKANDALNNLDGNTNLQKAKDKVDTFIHIPQTDRDQARDNLPTTSLTDLNQRVKDLKDINDTIGKNKDTIDKLPNINQDTKDKFKTDVAVVDWNKSKDENIKNSDDAKDTVIALNDKFVNLKLDLDEYLSIQQTPTYTAATNKDLVNKKVVEEINKILSKIVINADDVTSTNTFKHGISAADIDASLKNIEDAIAKLDGRLEVEKAKTKLGDEIATDEKYKNLSHATKQSLREMINVINSNHTDWDTKLKEVITIADQALQTTKDIDQEIAKAKANEDADRVVRLEESKEDDLTNVTEVIIPQNPMPNDDSKSNKIWWLFSLIAIIPISVLGFFVAKWKKRP
ncbi:hypothetical protein ACW95P_04895, partial [Candidatus Mycoplasma pogonae]